MRKTVKKAVIPAAGYGTRFLPATKALAKEMLPIVDTPTIELIVNEAIESGIEEILIIVSANKNSIMDHFDSNFELESKLKEKNKEKELEMINRAANGVNIHYIRQKEQLGLGHAVLHAKTFVGDEPFALLLGDDVYVGEKEPALKEMIDTYDECQNSIIGVLEIEGEDITKYGVCEPSGSQDFKNAVNLKGLIEKPTLDEAPSNLAIGGRYILTPKIFQLLENQEVGAGNEIQLTDSISRLLKFEKVFAKKLSSRRYDIGSRIGFIEATIDFALQRDDLKEQIKELINRKVTEINPKEKNK